MRSRAAAHLARLAELQAGFVVFCTNMDGASLAEGLEREVGIPVYDTVATAVWASLRTVGVRPDRIRNWGRLFREVK